MTPNFPSIISDFGSFEASQLCQGKDDHRTSLGWQAQSQRGRTRLLNWFIVLVLTLSGKFKFICSKYIMRRYPIPAAWWTHILGSRADIDSLAIAFLVNVLFGRKMKRNERFRNGRGPRKFEAG